MTDHQEPLGSGFGARTTATTVLADVDIKGRYAIVTGGHSGLGLETTKALVEAGVDVLVAARDANGARYADQSLVYGLLIGPMIELQRR